jgi:chorismate mutase
MKEGSEQQNIRCRGVRGATTVESDTREAIHSATRELVDVLMQTNGILPEDIASILFTTTPDLHSAFPAEAARLISPDWEYVPLMGAVEMDKLDTIPRCIRILLHWNTTKSQREVNHVYLRGTDALRRVVGSQ